MVRHITVVLISALMGSVLGTLVWVCWLGEGELAVPFDFITGFASITLIFTIPGAVLLMVLASTLAERGLAQARASILLVVFGTLAGGAMLAMFYSPYLMALGAMFGGLTAAAFVTALHVFGAYPAHSL